MLEHGGRLQVAAREFGIPVESWLDLSTGISPHSWAVERAFDIPAQSWSRLPEDEDGLAEAAQDYYGAAALPVAGSQAAIQALPSLRAPCRVAVLAPTYAEHERAWRSSGHTVGTVTLGELEARIDNFDVLVVVNPNNPDGRYIEPSRLLDWHAQLSARGGWLIVDEAFVDATPERSVVCPNMPEGLIVLRSLGKFFGLAGARVGFALAALPLRTALAEALGPWTLSGPSRILAGAALRDRPWQQEQRQRLDRDRARLRNLLGQFGLVAAGGTALFQWVPTGDADAVALALGRAGILVRRFEGLGLRFGLPGLDADWRRFGLALAGLRRAVA